MAIMLTQSEFIARYKVGERLFSDALLQFHDIDAMTFDGLVFRNAKLMFCTFHTCSFTNCRFENCTVYFGTFYGGTMASSTFDRCEIELTLFDGVQFSDTRMDRCTIRWLGVIGGNAVSLDLSTSSHFKVFSDLAQLSAADVDEAVDATMGALSRLDLSLRMKFKDMMRQDMERHGIEETVTKNNYSNTVHATHDSTLVTYGEARGLVEEMFGAYGTRGAYPRERRKSAYDRKGTYR